MQYIALNVACPLCGSAVGLNCRKPSGWMRGEFHKARKQAVEDSFPKHSDGTQDKRYSVGREFDDFGGMRYIARFMGVAFASSSNWQHAVNKCFSHKQQRGFGPNA